MELAELQAWTKEALALLTREGWTKKGYRVKDETGHATYCLVGAAVAARRAEEGEDVWRDGNTGGLYEIPFTRYTGRLAYQVNDSAESIEDLEQKLKELGVLA